MQLAINLMIQTVRTRHWNLTTYHEFLYNSDNIQVKLSVLFFIDVSQFTKIEILYVMCNLIKKMDIYQKERQK